MATWVMRSHKAPNPIVAAMCATVVMIAAAPAWAVDVINRDKQPRAIVVNDSSGESTTRTLGPQEKAANVCTACVILTGDTSIEVSGDVTVQIRGGKASVAKR